LFFCELWFWAGGWTFDFEFILCILGLGWVSDIYFRYDFVHVCVGLRIYWQLFVCVTGVG